MKYLFTAVLLGLLLGNNAVLGFQKPEQYFRIQSGTGFFVNYKYVITNAHVVNGCNQVIIKGAVPEHIATVQVLDTEHDLALLVTDQPPAQFAPLRFNIDDLRAGDRVYVVGYPGEAGEHGQVSAVQAIVLEAENNASGKPTKFYITDVVEHGNSGGPVLDGSGNVIGVVVAKTALNLINQTTQKIVFQKRMGVVITLNTLKDFLYQHGVSVDWSTSGPLSYAGNYVEELAQHYIVNVQCRIPVAQP